MTKEEIKGHKMLPYKKEEIKDKIELRKVWIKQLEVKKLIWESEIKEFIDILNK